MISLNAQMMATKPLLLETLIPIVFITKSSLKIYCNGELIISLFVNIKSRKKRRCVNCSMCSNSLGNKMYNSLLGVRDITYKYIIVERNPYEPLIIPPSLHRPQHPLPRHPFRPPRFLPDRLPLSGKINI